MTSLPRGISQADVLEAYRQAQDLNKTDFAAALKMSKQALNNYLNGSQQNLDGLQKAAKEHAGTWIGDLFVDLLTIRRAEIPCSCQTEIGDCGPCPKHGKGKR